MGLTHHAEMTESATPVPAFIAAQLQLRDPARYETYARRFTSTLAGFDGRLLAAADHPVVLVGNWPYDRFVLVQFPNERAALDWSRSSDYRRIAPDREAAAATTALLVAGRDEPRSPAGASTTRRGPNR